MLPEFCSMLCFASRTCPHPSLASGIYDICAPEAVESYWACRRPFQRLKYVLNVGFLRQKDTVRAAVNLNSQDVLAFAQVGHSEQSHRRLFDLRFVLLATKDWLVLHVDDTVDQTGRKFSMDRQELAINGKSSPRPASLRSAHTIA